MCLQTNKFKKMTMKTTDRSYQDKCSLTIFPVTHVVEITNLELKLGCTTINRGGLETH